MRRVILICLILFISSASSAQQDELTKENYKIRGLVNKVHIVKHMVRMVNDSLIYGEKWTDQTNYYNENGVVTKSYSIPDNNPSDTSFAVYSYYEDNNLMTKRISKNKNAFVLILKNTYVNGLLDEEGYLDSRDSGKFYADYKYVYYKDSTEKIYVADTIDKPFAKYMYRFKAKYVFFYDDNKSLVKQDYYTSDKLYESILYEYDLFNNVQSSKHYKGNVLEDTYTYDYEYDEHHNFIKRTEYKNKRIYSITTRNIEYQ
jgi:hypothetical protein